VLLSVFVRDERVIHFYVAVPWAKVILRVCGVKVRVVGQENLEGQAPRIYMTNHQSYFDIFALLACLPVDFKFVLKKELMKIPLFGFSMRRAGYIAIDREDPRKAVKSMKEAAERIRQGSSVLIFPEGTRSADGRLQPFKKGGFHLALKSGCDMVPVAIINSRAIVPKGSLRINKGSFTLNIGKPIPVKGYSRKNMDQLMARVREAILQQMGERN
jgi:1-acyl-sn-glycerol-3-phosphate acyltransferase